MKNWHCYINNQAGGPFPESSLRELINSGQLTTDTYVYNDSPEEAPKAWQRAGDTEISGLFMNANTLWFYAKDGNMCEPVPTDEIRNLIKKKIITAGTLIYSDTFSDIGWVKASETEFAEVFNDVSVLPQSIREPINSNSQTQIGKICPYCKTKIAANEDLEICPICNMPHHRSCWDENKGCTTFGCGGQHHEEQITNLSPNVSPSVAAAINLANASVVKKNKDRTVGYIATAVVVFAVVILVGGFISNAISTKKAEEARRIAEARKAEEVRRVLEAKKLYLYNVSLFQLRMLAAGSNLEDIADTIERYWHENIYANRHGADINSAIRHAQIDKMSEISNARTQKDEIDGLYKSVRNLPDDLRNDSDLRDIRDAARDLYNSYTSFYSLAISPTGSYTSYSADNNKKTDDFVSKSRVLSSLL
jgi:hypothetical protein